MITAGAVTLTASVFTADVDPARVAHPVLLTILCAAAAGAGSVHRAPRPSTRRWLLSLLAAFAAGMALAILAYALHSHLEDLQVNDLRHGVIWPLFAVWLVATFLLGPVAFLAWRCSSSSSAASAVDAKVIGPSSPFGAPSSQRWVLPLLPALLVALACGAEPRSTEGEPPAPIAASSKAPSSSVPAATPAPASDPSNAIELRLQFTADSWVKALVDGQSQVSELHIEGEEMVVNAQREIVLTVGNVGAVRATLNGRPYPLPGKTGDVVRDLVIRASAEP